METIKVNMNPNPLDVQTIHASQNDNEAREWGFELHNNGELIDTSNVTEQMFFKAYKGGTEQLLPENTSTPTTSPFIGDIRYPQGLQTDQEFTYRQSPTEEDGLAKITDVKGNTIVWNQLVQNGNFADSSLWTGQSTTVSISNSVANVTLSAKGNYVALRQSPFPSVTGHKYFVTATFKCTKKTAVGFYLNGQGVYLDGYDIQANTLTKVSALVNSGESGGFNIYVSRKNELEIGDVVQVSNVMLIDLTKMGLDSITDPSDFTSLFPLSYYAYDSGSLLSFNGSGIKTVGFNQWDGETESGYIYNGVLYASNDYWRTKNYIPVIANETYYFNVHSTQGQIALYDANKTYVSSVNSMGGSSHLVTIPSGCYFAKFYQPISSDSSTECVNISSSRNGEYEPYTESTLTLPVATYFPTGMKSAGSVYDELLPAKAITRVGTRAYQSGDENDSTLTTDGTNTNYPLATPTETSFTTASLVTENAEIPLSNDDGTLIGKCTEELSAEPGFHDAKIKLSDSDGTCYSNKLQLHVERSPQ